MIRAILMCIIMILAATLTLAVAPIAYVLYGLCMLGDAIVKSYEKRPSKILNYFDNKEAKK